MAAVLEWLMHRGGILLRGKFIVIEGIDGSGKTTQTALLYEKLIGDIYPVVLTREPGGTSIGESIRQLLLSPSNTIGPWTEILLYAAARAQLVDEVIIPSLKKGMMVLSDRYLLSSLAYQGAGRGEEAEKIYRLNYEITRGVLPDLTFILDLRVEEARKRLQQKGSATGTADRLEKMDDSFYQRVREGYLAFARENSSRVEVVSSEEEAETVHEAIWSKVKKIISAKEQ